MYPDTLPTTDAGVWRRKKQAIKTEKEQQLLLQQHQQQHGEQLDLNNNDMSDHHNSSSVDSDATRLDYGDCLQAASYNHQASVGAVTAEPASSITDHCYHGSSVGEQT